MGKPNPLQYLMHGKILCGRAFKTFVETWNWFVGAFSHLRGDADIDPKDGHVKVDWTNEDFPVIRLVNLGNIGGGGGGEVDGVSINKNTQGKIQVYGFNGQTEAKKIPITSVVGNVTSLTWTTNGIRIDGRGETVQGVSIVAGSDTNLTADVTYSTTASTGDRVANISLNVYYR